MNRRAAECPPYLGMARRSARKFRVPTALCEQKPTAFSSPFPPVGIYPSGMKPSCRRLPLISLASVLLVGCGPGTPSTPLHVAAGDGNYPAVRRHIAAHTDLNAKDKSGWTALHLAAKAGDLPMVQLLADAGADAARTGPQGKTAIDVAREQGQTSIVQFLEQRLTADAAKASAASPGQETGRRRLIDGGLGVSEVLGTQ